jgi:hypothetical protein
MTEEAPELDIDGLRSPTTDEIVVIVAWFDSDAAKQWMLNRGRVVLRLGRRRGTLPLIKSLSKATHILLHGRSYETVPGLLRIQPSPGEVWTRSEILAIGFPAARTGSADDIFAVFSVSPDASFEQFKWNGRSLDAALIRYRNRQRPTYRSALKALTREKAKPQIVSLADLQIALAK